LTNKTPYTRRDCPLTEKERGFFVRAIWIKKNIASRREKVAIAKFLAYQLIVLLLIALLLRLTWNYAAAISALLGGLLAWIPNIFLAIFIFTRVSSRDPKKIVNAFYMGEMLKIVLMCVLFVLMLHWYKIALGPFLIGMIGTYLTYLLLG